MKKISIQLTDVNVELIKFVKKDAYEDFGLLEGRTVENIDSEIEEVHKLQAQKPIAFFKQNDGSYILISNHKPETLVTNGSDGEIRKG